MKVDWYTKTILTVIAVCLVVLTLQQVSLIPHVYAAPVVAPSMLNEIKTNYDGSINVRVIEVNTPYEGLPVNIKNSSDIPVKVQNSYLYTKPY